MVSGIAKTIEDVLEKLGKNKELARSGYNFWEVEEGSAKIRINYNPDTYFIISDAFLCSIPKEQIAATYEFLLKENAQLRGMLFSLNGQNIVLSSLIYDLDLTVETGENAFRQLFQKADDYDDILIRQYGCIPILEEKIKMPGNATCGCLALTNTLSGMHADLPGQPSALHDILNSLYPLPQSALEALAACCSPVHRARGAMLFRAGRLESEIYFIEKGIVRAFCDQDEHEVTFWFGQEGAVVLSYNSYIHNRPGYEFVELLEDASLYRLSCAALQELFSRDISIANWGRKMAEKELVKTEERLISRQFRTASERYAELLQQNPELLQRVQLGHIASYLGINQVTLSRIRAQVK